MLFRSVKYISSVYYPLDKDIVREMWVKGDLKDQLGISHRKSKKNRQMASAMEAAPMFHEQHNRSFSEMSNIHNSYEPAMTNSPIPNLTPRQTYLDTPPLPETIELPPREPGVQYAQVRDTVPQPTLLSPPNADQRHLMSVSPQPSYYSVSDLPPASPLPSPKYRYPNGEVTSPPPSRRTSVAASRAGSMRSTAAPPPPPAGPMPTSPLPPQPLSPPQSPNSSLFVPPPSPYGGGGSGGSQMAEAAAYEMQVRSPQQQQYPPQHQQQQQHYADTLSPPTSPPAHHQPPPSAFYNRAPSVTSHTQRSPSQASHSQRAPTSHSMYSRAPSQASHATFATAHDDFWESEDERGGESDMERYATPLPGRTSEDTILAYDGLERPQPQTQPQPQTYHQQPQVYSHQQHPQQYPQHEQPQYQQHHPAVLAVQGDDDEVEDDMDTVMGDHRRMSEASVATMQTWEVGRAL